MKPLSKSQRVAAVVALGTAALLFLVFRPVPLAVDAVQVRYGALEVTLDAEGVTRVVDRYTVTAPVTGRLARIALSAGDSVRQGMEVASLRPPGLDAREYREASSGAGSARALLQEALARQQQVSRKLEDSSRRAGRYSNLYRDGAVSKESWELARSEADVLERERQAASAAVSAARSQLDAATAKIDTQVSGRPVPVDAPVDGRILRVHEKNERIVPAGSPLLDIGDPGTIELVIDVLSSDAVRVNPGQKVRVTEWGGGSILEGMVRSVEPAAFTRVSALGIEEKRVNVIAVLDGKEPRLGDNFRIQASVVLQKADKVLKVPMSSLFRGGDGWHVFVIDGGRAMERRVKIGMQGTTEAEVLGGLRSKDRVIVHPPNELKEGMGVRAQ